MLSIVIPTKNEEDHLPTLLESIRSQTLQPDEIIVADANSTDRTREIAESFGAIVVDGGMPAVGRNMGAAKATSDVILFLDADVDFFDEFFLEKSINEFSERNLGLATCDVYPLSDAYLDHFLHEVYNKYARAWGSIFPHAPGFCMFVKRELHNKLGGFDETILLSEDQDYAHRFVKIGKFGFLKSTKIPVSIRRFDRDGRMNIAVKYVLAELHMAFVGPIRTNKFNYTFGYSKKTKPKSEKVSGEAGSGSAGKE